MAILIVDDDVVTALALGDAFDAAGYQVETANDAEHAYAKLADEPRTFSAIVTDINLGGGDDGFEVARRARDANPSIQVAYVTAEASNLKRFEPDCALLFSKPFDPAEIVNQLSLLIPAHCSVKTGPRA